MNRSGLIVALCLAWPAAAAISEPAGISPLLRALPGEEPAFSLRADGVQVYQCSPLPTGGYAWALQAPDATLFDGNHSVARLATPNHWESLEDRSSVTGIPRRMQAAGGANMPWELLGAMPTGEDGMFAGVTTIQRVNTRGGAAPTSACDDTHVGEQASSAFTADYYFYKRRGTG
jgi:uncharacterized protein DUF3455